VHTTINSARTLIVNFTRVSLAGEVPPAAAGSDDFAAVTAALTRDPVFFADAVADWPASRRRALFEMLAAAIVALRTHPPHAFRGEAFVGSTPAAVASGFGSWLAALPRRARAVRGQTGATVRASVPVAA